MRSGLGVWAAVRQEWDRIAEADALRYQPQASRAAPREADGAVGDQLVR